MKKLLSLSLILLSNAFLTISTVKADLVDPGYPLYPMPVPSPEGIDPAIILVIVLICCLLLSVAIAAGVAIYLLGKKSKKKQS